MVNLHAFVLELTQKLYFQLLPTCVGSSHGSTCPELLAHVLVRYFKLFAWKVIRWSHHVCLPVCQSAARIPEMSVPHRCSRPGSSWDGRSQQDRRHSASIHKEKRDFFVKLFGKRVIIMQSCSNIKAFTSCSCLWAKRRSKNKKSNVSIVNSGSDLDKVR